MVRRVGMACGEPKGMRGARWCVMIFCSAAGDGMRRVSFLLGCGMGAWRWWCFWARVDWWVRGFCLEIRSRVFPMDGQMIWIWVGGDVGGVFWKLNFVRAGKMEKRKREEARDGEVALGMERGVGEMG
jgi:hypothetical protein